MATFRIGQRVKKIALGGNSKNKIPVGTESVVTGFAESQKGREGYDLTVRFAGRGCDELDTWARCWEPIQYDGTQKIEWSQCMWLPEHMREKMPEATKEAA